MEKEFDIVAIGTMAYDMILRTVDETAFTRDTTVLESVGISSGGGAMTSVIAAQRVGCKTALVGRVCQDDFSSYLLRVLDEAGVDFAMYIHRNGAHGLSTADELVYSVGKVPAHSRDVDGWMYRVMDFLTEVGFGIRDGQQG